METTIALDPKIERLRNLCWTIFADADKQTMAAMKRERRAIVAVLADLLGRTPTEEEIRQVHNFA